MIKANTFKKAIQITANEDGSLPTEIELLQTGQWDTPWHGRISISPQDLEEYVRNFENDVRASSSTHGLPVDFEHRGSDGAAGWIMKLYVKANSLYGSFEWNKKGSEALLDKQYKFISPEFCPEDYEDPEKAGNYFNNVLIAAGLTARPLFKGLKPVTANEDGNKNKKSLTANNNSNIIYLSEEKSQMNLKDIFSKKASEFTEEEKEFIKANSDKLTDDQKKSFDFLGGEGKKDTKKANDDAKKEEDLKKKEAKKPVEAKDSVTISKAEFDALSKKADEGAEAAQKINRIEASDRLEKAIFASDKMPITVKEDVVDFYQSLNTKQKKAFDGIVDKLPKVEMFKEIGASDAVSGDAADQLTKKAHELQKEDSNLTFSEALRKAGEQNPELAKKYEGIEE